jgi:hypothetical protein
MASLLVLGLVSSGTTAAGRSDYLVRHYDLRSLPWTELSLTGWHRMALPPDPPVDRDRIPLVRKGGVLSYAIGELSMSGMRRLTHWLVRCDRDQLDQALAQAAKLRQLAIRRRGAWWLPHWFDYPPYGMKAPWFNAMTQGLALSFFVRLYRITGDEVHLDAAREVFRSFLRLRRGPGPWVAYVDDGYLWLEHYPNAHPDHILNAHMHALFGLYEYWDLTRSPRARRVLEGAITTMDDNLRRYRRAGGVSYYGLRSRTTIAKYHRIHVWQTALLAAITGDRSITRMAQRYRDDLRGRKTWRGTPGYPRLPEAVTCPDGEDPRARPLSGPILERGPAPDPTASLPPGIIPPAAPASFDPTVSLDPAASPGLAVAPSPAASPGLAVGPSPAASAFPAAAGPGPGDGS